VLEHREVTHPRDHLKLKDPIVTSERVCDGMVVRVVVVADEDMARSSQSAEAAKHSAWADGRGRLDEQPDVVAQHRPDQLGRLAGKPVRHEMRILQPGVCELVATLPGSGHQNRHACSPVWRDLGAAESRPDEQQPSDETAMGERKIDGELARERTADQDDRAYFFHRLGGEVQRKPRFREGRQALGSPER
jgi:hypothetical protein